MSDENRACYISIRVFKITDLCVHTIRFSEPTKIGSLKTDRVNEPLARRLFYGISAGCGKVSLYPGNFGGNAHRGSR